MSYPCMKKKSKELSEKFDIDIYDYLEKAEEAAKIREEGEMNFWINLATEKAKKKRININPDIKNIRKILKGE